MSLMVVSNKYLHMEAAQCNQSDMLVTEQLVEGHSSFGNEGKTFPQADLSCWSRDPTNDLTAIFSRCVTLCQHT